MNQRQKKVLAIATLTALGCLVALLARRTVYGEVFTHEFAKAGSGDAVRVLKQQAGTVIYILDADLNEKLLVVLNDRYNQNPEPPTGKQIGTNSLLQLFRQQFPTNQQSDTEVLLEVGQKYPDQLAKFPDAKAEHDALVKSISWAFDPQPVLDFDDKRIQSILQSATSVTADSSGKFSVSLWRGKTYFAVAESAISAGVAWHIRLNAPGGTIALSDANKIKDRKAKPAY